MIYVVGEKLGTGRTRRRLSEMIGVDEESMMERVCWTNLWDVPGQHGAHVARMIEQAAQTTDAIVLLGRRVAEVFALADREPLTEIARNGGIGPVVLLLPHPSGKNLWYNDPGNRESARAAVRLIWARAS
jgi:hypothetical protein